MPYPDGTETLGQTPIAVQNFDRGGAVYNVMHPDFNAVGDGVNDDTAEIQAAIDAAEANSGGVVYFPRGTYRISSQLTVTVNGIRLEFAAGAVIDFSDFSDSTPAILVQGTLGTSTTLSANATDGATALSVTSESGFSAGGWAILGSDYVPGDASIPQGELVRVLSTAAGTLNLHDAIVDSYTTANNGDVVPFTPIEDFSIVGGEFLADTDDTIAYIAVRVDRCVNVRVSGTKFRYCHSAGVEILQSSHVVVSDCHFADALYNGVSYGVAVVNCSQDVAITNCTAYRTRHAVTMVGYTTRDGMPRRVVVSNCTASQCRAAGFDSHAGANDISFVNCMVLGSDIDGIVMQASTFVIMGCMVKDIGRIGILIQASDDYAMDGVCIGNRIDNTDDQGIDVSPSASYTAYEGLVISGNKITNTGQQGIRVLNSDAAHRVEGLVISGNVLTDIDSHGIHLQRVQRVTVSNNVVELSTAGTFEAILANISDDLTIVGNVTLAPSSNGRGVRLLSVTDATVNGNRCDGHSIGIQLDNNCVRCVVDGNNLAGNTTTLDPGTSTTILLGRNILANALIQTLANDATPSVQGGHLFFTGGTTTITDFDDGVVGQIIEIRFDHAVTITDGSNILLNGSANFVGAVGDVLTLRMFNDQVWEEVSRKVN